MLSLANLEKNLKNRHGCRPELIQVVTNETHGTSQDEKAIEASKAHQVVCLRGKWQAAQKRIINSALCHDVSSAGK